MAYEGSFFTIAGCPGEASVGAWAAAYAREAERCGAGIVGAFIWFTGADLNGHFRSSGADAWPDDEVFIMFGLDGLRMSSVVEFLHQAGGRWFDDMVDSAAVRARRI